MKQRPDWPLLVLAAVFATAGGVLGFLVQAPNRLVSGHGVASFHALPWWALLGLSFCAAWFVLAACGPRTRTNYALVLASSCACVLLLLAGAGASAAAMAQAAPQAARISLGAGFWTMEFASALVAVHALQSLRARPALRCSVAVACVAGIALLALSGVLDKLSIAQEYGTHSAVFAIALRRHLLLVVMTLGMALAAGVPLGIAVQRKRAWRGSVFAVLNIVQTVPSVALFGLLIAPLSAVGLSGIGIVPALMALVLYALLPIVRNTQAGLDGADPATLEAARGMGMAPRQILLRVELPLAAPALIAGLRIVTVQTIGLAVVAALIGAGGLGDFVFQGLGQYAVDLVLLGALPAIGFALAADFLLQIAAARFQMQPT